ncbi:LETM1 domain-containing protein mdm28, mitochondrial [Sparassis crispa]|uniref:Mitochondrial proton/calcium exchanger protein n=1 Tax=Sparassis crispa TaxID=139825 RepID=A0A401GKD8_9APHY|nr:LETM1 domain-containing protein mdm28, mitochondrial [Sparassis crispa]GBE82633.1 LETM1 domain-containing protein mdm28, mitochondrial [Sparassis crispa]
MSLWLPRPSPSVLARTYSRQTTLVNVRIVALVSQNSRHHRNHPHLLVRRFQSTQSGPDAPKNASTSAGDASMPDPKPTPPTPKEEVIPLSTRVWKKVKHEAQHYWHGSKLLVSEVRISSRLMWKILHGDILTRRERRQLKRTTQDLLRLVPFAVIVIVPFMELLLPVILAVFPNMLPSTFEDKFAAEEKQRKLLRVRLDMAKFLQETLRESGLKANAHIVGSDAFKEFFRKVRSTGESPSATDVINVARLFDDDLTLDNLSRPQLVSMCRYMGINAFGTDNFLRGTIRTRLLELRRDDNSILAEGVDELSTSELQAACQSRGIRTTGISPARLRDELSTWINLHLQNRVSGVLLVLARAFQFDKKPGLNEDGKAAIIQSVESVLSGLPDNLLNEAELEVDSDKASYKQKLDVLQQQEELIEDEKEQEQKEEDARRARKEEEARLARSLLPESEFEPEKLEEGDARMTTEQLKELAEALSVLSSTSSIKKERDELRALMEENLHAEEDPKSPSGALTKRIRTMLTKIDGQIWDYDARVGSSLQMISCDPQGRISVEDLEKALAVIKHKPDEEVGHRVIEKLDVDKDGFVELEHVLGLVREEGLGTVLDDEAQSILGQGNELRNSKPRKEDIVQE